MILWPRQSKIQILSIWHIMENFTFLVLFPSCPLIPTPPRSMTFNRKLTEAERISIIEYVTAHGNAKEVKLTIAGIHHCSLATVFRVMAAYHQNGRTWPMKSGGHPYIFDKSDRMTIYNISYWNQWLVTR